MATGQFPNVGRFTRRRSPGLLGRRQLRRFNVLQVTTPGVEQYGVNAQNANVLSTQYFWGDAAGPTVVSGTAEGSVTVVGVADGTVSQAVTSGTASGSVDVFGLVAGSVFQMVTVGSGFGEVTVSGVAVGSVSDPSAPMVDEDMADFAHITGLQRNARRTELLRAKGFALLTDRVTALEGAVTDWTDFTPSWTNYTRGNGTFFARKRYVFGDLEIEVVETLGTTSAVGTGPTLTLPDSFLAHSGLVFATVGFGNIADTGVGAYDVNVRLSSSSAVQVYSVDAAANSLTTITATYPFTWTSGDLIRLKLTVSPA